MVTRKKLFSIVAIFISLLFINIAGAMAQDVSSIDFKNLKASQLSDQQIKRLWDRAQSQGYSVSEVQQMALARGMQPSEVSKLVDRLRKIRLQGNQQQAKKNTNAQLRSVTTDSTALSASRTRQDTTQKSRIFGANLFRNDKVSFTPSLNIPTPEDYQLGPGDQLVIDIWGAAEQTYQLTVSPEGTISIANLGPIYVNGLSMDKARDRIRSSLTKIYSGLKAEGNAPTDTHARISLGNIRSINVTVLGNARYPGTYTLPSLSTVFNALYSAGGPDSTGTFRDIEVIRGDSIAAHLDIYDFLVYGDQSDNIRLRDQDIIKIDPYISRVDLEGKTKRTGYFEMKKDETIQDLVTFAGGFSKGAYTKRIKVIGNTDTQKRINDIKYPEQRDFQLSNGDSVSVGKVLDRYANRVKIQGAVFRDGNYELNDTTTVYSLIQRAGGIREDAFMNRGLIYREQDDLTIKTIPFSVRQIMKDPAKNDIELERNDIVQISSIFDLRDNYQIKVFGAVQSPGTYPYAQNMTLEDVIFQANGFKESAAPYRIEVSRRIDGTDSAFVPTKIANIFRFEVDKNLELGDKAKNFTLKPFDEVFVRTAPSYQPQQEVTVKGEVMFPGQYTLDEKYMRVSDLIQRAGGMTEFAYPQGANLTREVEQKVDTTFLNIPDSAGTGGSLRQQTTKVGIQLPEILKHPGTNQDIILRPGDVLEIPKELQTVKVAGEVLYPISVRYQDHMSFKDYMRAAGGASDMGKPKDAYIVYANGEVDRTRKFLFWRNYPDVRPGATIYVPKKPQERKLTAQERIGILSAIVSMAAIVSNTIFQVTR